LKGEKGDQVLRTGFFAVDQWREDGGGDQDDQCGEQCVPATDVGEEENENKKSNHHKEVHIVSRG
jgi:hypothetical protein